MTNKSPIMFAAAFCGLAIATATAPAQALTIQECSAKYEAAKKDGSLGAKKWNDFRKSDCSADAKPAATTAVTPAPAPTPKAAETKSTARQAPKETPKPAAPPITASGPAVFPSAVSTKYSSESTGKARMHTCLDQYKANKDGAGTGNGGMRWIEKGGGYYSQCNAKLKG